MSAATRQRRGTQRTNSDAMGRPPKEPDLSTYRGQFGANLRELRSKKYETIEEAANAIGVTTSALAHWERGFRTPSVEQLPAIASALGVKVSKLLPEPQ